MKKSAIYILIIAVVVVGIIWIAEKKETSGSLGGQKIDQNNNQVDNGPTNNVSTVDGKQIIEIKAKGGYSPRITVAKANIPTILRFNTNSTFDCSSYIRIPSMKITKILSQSGATDIDLGSQQAGKLQGTCGMGMYFFEIDFKEWK